MSAALRQLVSWIEEWAPPELAGGMPGRDARIVHDWCFDDIEDAYSAAGKGNFAGFKRDLRKCFYHVTVEQGLYVLQKLGAPPQLIRIMRSFYARMRMWVDARGVTAKDPIHPNRGLIAGCPASCLILNALMACWVWALRPTGTRAVAYIDDRKIWTRSSKPLQALRKANDITESFDSDCKFVNNSDKGELFGMTVKTRQQLQPLAAALAPKIGVCDKFTMLGVVYSSSRTRHVQLNCSGRKGQLQDRVRVVCQRIQMATNRTDLRKQLVKTLMLAATSWAGAYNRPSRKVLQQWTRDIEKCILGKMPSGKSTLLVWDLLIGPECDPTFQIAKKIISLETWKVNHSEVHIDQLENGVCWMRSCPRTEYQPVRRKAYWTAKRKPLRVFTPQQEKEEQQQRQRAESASQRQRRASSRQQTRSKGSAPSKRKAKPKQQKLRCKQSQRQRRIGELMEDWHWERLRT
eukprot:12429565-Karenia_brevis.AAC.1